MKSLVGETIGPYRVESEIGRGGMGVVFKAVHETLNRRVALKILTVHPLADDRDASERFLREARMIAKLNHPNVVQVYDAGSSGGFPYIAMEFVDGKPLSRLIEEGERLQPADAARIVRECGEALLGAAELGIVHRDVKPSNVLLGADGRVKLTDFGLAKALHVHDKAITLEGSVLGTPMYMSPEQVLGEPVDSRSDMYSLGLVFLELLSCRPPFEPMPGTQLLQRRIRDPRAEPEALGWVGLPSEARPFLHRALAPSLDLRFPDFRAFVSEIAALERRLRAPSSLDSNLASVGPLAPGGGPRAERPAPPAAAEGAPATPSALMRDVLGFGAASLELLRQSWLGSLEGKPGMGPIAEIVAQRLHQLEENRSDLLRIVLFGEFKAGKSSLVNAIYGRKIAAVDILEMTSWICRILPTEGPEYCSLHLKDQSTESVQMAEFLEKTEGRLYPADFLSRIEYVEMGIRAPGLPCLLMDTPGTGSVTRENESRMLRAIADGDLLLWVCDATALGSLRDTLVAETAHKNGVPVICALTKCDALASAKEEADLVKWVSEESGIPADHVFPTRGLGASKRPRPFDESTGVRPLVAFLRDQAAPRRASVRESAFMGHSVTFVREVGKLLEDAMRRLTDLGSDMALVENQLALTARAILQQVHAFATNRIETSLLEPYVDAITRAVADEISAAGSSELSCSRVLERAVPPDYFDGFWKAILADCEQRMIRQWEQEAGKIEAKFESKLVAIKGGLRACEPLGAVTVAGGSSGFSMEAFATSVTTSLAVAGLASFYVATIGPAAASISLGAALSGIGIPLALIGLGVGVGFGLYARRKRTRSPAETARHLVELVRAQAIRGFLEESVMPALTAWNRKMGEAVSRSIVGVRLNLGEAVDVEALRGRLSALIAEGNRLIAALSRGGRPRAC